MSEQPESIKSTEPMIYSENIVNCFKLFIKLSEQLKEIFPEFFQQLQQEDEICIDAMNFTEEQSRFMSNLENGKISHMELFSVYFTCIASMQFVKEKLPKFYDEVREFEIVIQDQKIKLTAIQTVEIIIDEPMGEFNEAMKTIMLFEEVKADLIKTQVALHFVDSNLMLEDLNPVLDDQ